MYTFLLVLLILVSLVLVAAVLLQAGKGGGLAASFGGASSSSNSFIGTRQAGNLLTRISWWGGGIFLFLSFVLSLMSARSSGPRSILEQGLPAPAAPTAPPAQGGANAPALPIQPQGTPPAPATQTPPPQQ